MAGIKVFEAPGCRISLCADKDYGPEKRYIPVKLVAGQDGVFTEATESDNVVGVLQNEVKAGEAGQIALDGVTYYLASAKALQAGDTVGKWGTVICGAAKGAIASVLIRPVTGSAGA